jgi:hypothetical protein
MTKLRAKIATSFIFTNIILVVSLNLIVHVSGLVGGPSNKDISIVGLAIGDAGQSLPAAYLKSFRRWRLNLPDPLSTDSPTATLIPGTDFYGRSAHDSYVNPTTTTELWWPSDLSSLQVRPALDIVLRSGVPTYVLAGLNVRVPPEASSDHTEWWNYGLHSQPLARQWMAFSWSGESSFRLECFVGHRLLDEKDSDCDNSTDQKEWEWTNFFPKGSENLKQQQQLMQKALGALGSFISSTGQDLSFAEGFHIVSCPLTDSWVDLKNPSLNLNNNEINSDTRTCYKIACVATAEPDAEEILYMDDSLMPLAPASVLLVEVTPSESGSLSPYLPHAYKSLYLQQKLS